MAVVQDSVPYRPDGLMPGMVAPARHPRKRLYYQRRMATSLTLQTIVYFNVWYSLLYFVLMAATVSFKNRTTTTTTPAAVNIISAVLLAIWSLVEVCRLYLVFVGNLQERVQHLAAFFFLSLFPQLLLVGYSLAQPSPIPLEQIAACIQIAFLLAELVVGYGAIRYIIRVQTTRFRLDYPYRSLVEELQASEHLS